MLGRRVPKALTPASLERAAPAAGDSRTARLGWSGVVSLAAYSLGLPRRWRHHRHTRLASAPADGAAQGRQISQLDAFFALVKGNLGPGLLALPFAFAHTGWVLGTPIFLLTVAQGVYTMLVLAECKRALTSPDVVTMGDVAQKALGAWGRRVAEIFVFVVQGGVCCCFVDLVTGNMIDVLGKLFGPLSSSTVTLLMAPVFLGMSMFRNVAQLSSLNKLGIVAMAFSVVIGTVVGVQRLGAMGAQTAISAAAWSRRPITDSMMLAAAVFYSFEGLGLVLPVQREMRTPSAFPKVIWAASAFLVVAFLCVTFTCGVAFRAELDTASLMAFLAVRTTGAMRTALEIANVLVTAAVVFTFPLQLLPAAQILNRWMSSKKSSEGAETSEKRPLIPPWIFQHLVLVGGCVATSLAVTNVALLVSLFGAVGQTGLGLIAPICHMALMRSGAIKMSPTRMGVNFFVVGFCLMVMATGTFGAVTDIIESVHHHPVKHSMGGAIIHSLGRIFRRFHP